FFFFQAEDGIRDRTVTGVQTCALPIFGLRASDRRLDDRGQHRSRAADRPVAADRRADQAREAAALARSADAADLSRQAPRPRQGDRKSTRLNSSHRTISYAVFCLKKKK